jgi:hypothetical protein
VKNLFSNDEIIQLFVFSAIFPVCQDFKEGDENTREFLRHIIEILLVSISSIFYEQFLRQKIYADLTGARQP